MIKYIILVLFLGCGTYSLKEIKEFTKVCQDTCTKDGGKVNNISIHDWTVLSSNRLDYDCVCKYPSHGH